MTDKTATLADAVAAHVRAGDTLHVMVGHSRWTAAAREVCRQWWGRDPGFTLVMASLSSLGTLFFRGGLVRKVVTAYSGDIFPTFTPNPEFAAAYRSGAVEVEHWSFLALVQRMEAAARGLPAAITDSVVGSSMEGNAAFARMGSPFGDGELGLLAPLLPDVALLHAPIADRHGHVAFNPPLLEDVWGARAARRGTIVTVERIVDDIRPWAHLVRLLPAHVAAVCEVPMGAHPGGLYAPLLPVEPYGEDLAFWADARAASHDRDPDALDRWAAHWVREPADQSDYLDRLGGTRCAELRGRADPASWQADAAAHPPDLDAPANRWEVAAVLGARHLARRIRERDAHGVLAGAGVANLAAWLAVEQARAAGSDVVLTAELGLWGYEPTPADPYIFNHRAFPSATMVTDSATVLGMVVGGPATTTLACLGAAQVDRWGDLNSTDVPGGPFLVGSGGGNDVASRTAEAVVVTLLDRRRTPEKVGYVTSPGRAVVAVATDLGVLERRHGELVLAAVVDGAGTVADRVAAARAACGWPLHVADDLVEAPAPTAGELAALRRWDPRGIFLRG